MGWTAALAAKLDCLGDPVEKAYDVKDVRTFLNVLKSSKRISANLAYLKISEKILICSDE